MEKGVPDDCGWAAPLGATPPPGMLGAGSSPAGPLQLPFLRPRGSSEHHQAKGVSNWKEEERPREVSV